MSDGKTEAKDASGRRSGALTGYALHEDMKKRVGIDTANCLTCANLGTEDDGNYPEYAVSWHVCRRFPHYENLKNFPFKTEQKCWEPEFWHSTFTDLITNGEHEEVMMAIGEFVKARDAAEV